MVQFMKLLFPTLFISLILNATVLACPLELPVTTVTIKGHALVVEVAATPRSRQCGLSKRSVLDANQGMLFVYPEANVRTFWMKNTWIPLSIAFLDDSGTIINIETMSPAQTRQRYRSSSPATYALEVNQGWFRWHGVEAGDRVEMEPPLLKGSQAVP
jgi:uncharacterized membrane protein (UPF0127 family)